MGCAVAAAHVAARRARMTTAEQQSETAPLILTPELAAEVPARRRILVPAGILSGGGAVSSPHDAAAPERVVAQPPEKRASAGARRARPLNCSAATLEALLHKGPARPLRLFPRLGESLEGLAAKIGGPSGAPDLRPSGEGREPLGRDARTDTALLPSRCRFTREQVVATTAADVLQALGFLCAANITHGDVLAGNALLHPGDEGLSEWRFAGAASGLPVCAEATVLREASRAAGALRPVLIDLTSGEVHGRGRVTLGELDAGFPWELLPVGSDAQMGRRESLARRPHLKDASYFEQLVQRDLRTLRTMLSALLVGRGAGRGETNEERREENEAVQRFTLSALRAFLDREAAHELGGTNLQLGPARKYFSLLHRAEKPILNQA